MTHMRRAGVVLALTALVAAWAAALTYGLAHGRLPPTRVNLFGWIDPDSATCVEDALSLERAPLLGTNVALNNVCTSSAGGGGGVPSSAASFAGLLLFTSVVLAASWWAWPAATPTPRAGPATARDR